MSNNENDNLQWKTEQTSLAVKPLVDKPSIHKRAPAAPVVAGVCYEIFAAVTNVPCAGQEFTSY